MSERAIADYAVREGEGGRSVACVEVLESPGIAASDEAHELVVGQPGGIGPAVYRRSLARGLGERR
jgi:hypothetical protein